MLKRIMLVAVILILVSGLAQARGPGYLYSEGKKHLRKGQQDLAFLRFQHIAQFYPDSRYADEAQFRVAEYYFKTKKYRSAKKELEVYLDRFPEGKFREQVQGYIDGMAAGKAIKKADGLYKRKKWRDALELYQQAWKASPETGGLKGKLDACKEEVVEELIKEGELLADRQKWHKASQSYARALELDPGKSSLKEKIDQLNANLAQEQEKSSEGMVKHEGEWVAEQEKAATEQEKAPQDLDQ